ncbi:MAG: Xaa-Pro dipeptidase, partial [Pseudohongiellaceae bacterium]
PLLLEPQRNTAIGKMLNWSLIDELYPYGGIRIEDNIRVNKSGAENLTRGPHPKP